MSYDYDTPYSPMEEPEKKDNKLLIIIAIVLVVICCCCLIVSGALYWLWNNGDQIFEDFMDSLGFVQFYLLA